MLVDERGHTVALTNRPLVAGRARDSDIILKDPRASRRHFLIQASADGWVLSDLNSTNGTIINGRRLPAGHTHILARGDRIVVGDTVFEVQLVPAPEPKRNIPRREEPGEDPTVSRKSRAVSSVVPEPPPWQWVASALALAGVILAGIGTFQPWLRVDVRFTLAHVPGGQFLSDLLSAVEQAASAILGVQPLVKSRSILIEGTEAFGGAMLATGIIALLVVVLDLALRLSRSSLPGIAYVFAALAPIGVIGSDIYRVRNLADKEIIFGIDLLKIVEGAGQLLEIRIVPLNGLYMTGIGLGVLLLAGCFRLIGPLLSRTA